MTTEIISSYIKNFPFPTFRENQEDVLRQIEEAFNSGYKYIILEAPTGFGKSPVAIAVALTLGTSYICTSIFMNIYLCTDVFYQYINTSTTPESEGIS
ncbi:MAG: DEAD/DEAH box helicase family protein [Candidatus Nitrosopolaris sp.]